MTRTPLLALAALGAAELLQGQTPPGRPGTATAPHTAPAAATSRAAASATAPATAPAASKAFAEFIHAQIGAAMAAMIETGDTKAAEDKFARIFELVIGRATDKQYDLFRDADYALQLAHQMGEVPEARRRDLLDFLTRHDALSRTMVYTLTADDSIADAYALFDRLRTQRPAQVDGFATLVAAICAVHDEPLVRHINEARVTAPDPLAIFDYYVANEKAMVFGVRNVPPELLIYVVDTTATIDEMKWALARYGRDANIGRHFFDVKYDEAYFHDGAPKKLDSVPYTLPNILQVGGVCADQAYFAVSIGKAIGVPAVYTRGRSAETGHAWVGFLQAQGQRGAWNFDTARYEEFKGVAGFVEDPQTGGDIPDAFLSFTAEMINTTAQARQTALALSDAAAYMSYYEDSADFGTTPLPEAAAEARVLRQPSIASELDLCRQSLLQNPGNARAWGTVSTLASKGKMSYDQKKLWSDELLRQCGQRYPDFALEVLMPMIETIDDPQKQNALWNAAFDRFQGRPDLCASIRMEQAEMWEKQKQLDKAGLCYTDVIDRYVNAGPFVIPALAGAERILRTQNRPAAVPVLYAQAWAKCKKPDDMAGEFMRESNWYRVGMMLARRLSDANQGNDAARVMSQLGAAQK